MTHDSHFLTFMKRFTFKSVFSGTICSRRNVPLYFFYKVQKIGYQKHDNNRHRNGGCSACDHTEVFMAVESLGKCLRALQVAFSDYSGNHCRLISRLVIKKTYPWYAGLRSTNGYTVVFRSKILVLISNSGNDVIDQVKQRQWVFPEKKLNLPWKRKCLILQFWNQHNINILIRCGFSGILYLKVSLKTVWNT